MYLLESRERAREYFYRFAPRNVDDLKMSISSEFLTLLRCAFYRNFYSVSSCDDAWDSKICARARPSLQSCTLERARRSKRYGGSFFLCLMQMLSVKTALM